MEEQEGDSLVQQPNPEDASSRRLIARLAGATFNYGLGQVLPQVLAFLLIPVYTAYLSPEDYGLVELALTLGPIIAILMRAGLPGAVTRFYFDHNDTAALRDYVTTIHRVLIANGLLVGLLVIVVLYFFGNSLVPGLSFFPYMILAVVGAMAASNSDLQRRLIQAREQAGYSARLSIAFGVVGAGLTVLFVAGMGWGAAGMVFGGTLTSALFFLQAQRYLWADTSGKFRVEMLRSTLPYAAGIFPSNLMGRVTPFATRAILSGATSVGAVGLLGLANRFALPLAFLSDAFNRAYLPVYFAVRQEETPSNLRQLAVVESTVWISAVFAFLALSLLAPSFIVLITPQAFHGASSLIPVIAAGFLVRVVYYLCSAEIFHRKQTQLVPFISAGGIATTLGITVATVGAHGAMGVAWAMLAGHCVTTLIAGFFSWRLIRIPHDWPSLARVSVVAGGIFAANHWVSGPDITFELVKAALLLAAFPAILWIFGEPNVRLGISHLKVYFRSRRKIA